MLGMDGWEFLRRQKADPAPADIPVVIVSGGDPRQAVVAALGVSDYLQKPMDIDDMLAKVSRIATGASQR